MMDKQENMRSSKSTQYIILSDFDGTIAIDDVNELIFEVFGNADTDRIEQSFLRGEIGDRELLLKKYQLLNIPEKEYRDFILNHIELDQHFKAFYTLIKKYAVDFSIVSGGFIYYIELLFQKANIDFHHPIYSNTLHFKEKCIQVEFLHNINKCHQTFGICGNCKYEVVKHYKFQGKKIVYIGDGMTDRCVAKEVDILLAKKNKFLENYCLDNKVQYIPYSSFDDIIKYFQFQEGWESHVLFGG